MLVAGTATLFLVLFSIIAIQTYIKREVVAKSKFPICKDMIEEFKFCGRCLGFYTGAAFFGILMAIKNMIYVDLLNLLGPYPYLVLLFVTLLSVPIHGALRRLKLIHNNRYVHVVGFIFSSSIYLIASFVIFMLYRTT